MNMLNFCLTYFLIRAHTMLTRAGSHDSIIDALGGVSPKQEDSPEIKLEKEVVFLFVCFFPY